MTSDKLLQDGTHVLPANGAAVSYLIRKHIALYKVGIMDSELRIPNFRQVGIPSGHRGEKIAERPSHRIFKNGWVTSIR